MHAVEATGLQQACGDADTLPASGSSASGLREAAGRRTPQGAPRPFLIAEPEAAGRLDDAVTTLERRYPALSARTGLTKAQRGTLAGMALAAVLLALFAPAEGRLAVELVFALAFAAPLMVRLLAISQALKLAPAAAATVPPPPAAESAALPVYTVLIALYREAAVVSQLIEAMQALDYPIDRLDIIFAIETDDQATQTALLAAHLPAHMRIVIVPDGKPRTKPRALCYALAFARGTYVVVYDAEDQPEPDQLLKAASAFAAGEPLLGCLQARLNVYNRHESWLTRQFAIEYTSLFDAVLPAYARLNIPVPLGGTSNHFPRAILDYVGGWDPYNVTEDADLGVRLARFGYRVAMLPSTTWEEAPPRARDWFAQRTRWQKGWLQTYFLHMRNPAALVRDLGPLAWLWFQVVIGGGLLSALVHPWLYAWAAWHAVTTGISIPAISSIGGFVWWIAFATMIATFVAAISLAILTLRKRGFGDMIPAALAAPLYWLPISVAAYGALLEWLTSPFYWAKTPHRPRHLP